MFFLKRGINSQWEVEGSWPALPMHSFQWEVEGGGPSSQWAIYFVIEPGGKNCNYYLAM